MLDSATWSVRSHDLKLDDPLVMGILNVTPDSFSDGGNHHDIASAIAAGIAMVRDGAAIVDVGGESTRPGALPVDLETERSRVIPVVEALASEGVVVSVDTSKAMIAEEAISAGASIINDVTGLRDPDMATVCADAGVGVVIMHMQGDPQTMQHAPSYDDVVVDVKKFLAGRALHAIERGVRIGSIAIDPGIGFGKTHQQNLTLLAELDALVALGYPVLVGTSRKGFLGTILEPIRGRTDPSARDGATAASVAAAVLRGASIVRVHNVALGVDVAMTAKAMVRRRS